MDMKLRFLQRSDNQGARLDQLLDGSYSLNSPCPPRYFCSQCIEQQITLPWPVIVEPPTNGAEKDGRETLLHYATFVPSFIKNSKYSGTLQEHASNDLVGHVPVLL
jgi:hypothetical protein